MNQFEEPASSPSTPSETQEPPQQTVNKRQSQSSQKSTQPRLGHIASHINSVLSPKSSPSALSEAATTMDASQKTRMTTPTPKQVMTLSGAFPTTAKDSPEQQPLRDTDKRHNQALLNPTSPTTFTASQIVGSRHLNNRLSMPNLTGGPALQQQQTSHGPHNNSKSTLISTAPSPGKTYLQDVPSATRSTSGTQSAYNLPKGNASGMNMGGYGDDLTSLKQEVHQGQNYFEDSQHFQPGMIPRSTTEYYNQQMLAAGLYNSAAGVPPAQQPTYGYNNHGGSSSNGAPSYPQPSSYRHNIANFEADQLSHSKGQPSVLHSDLSLENLAKHNRSQSALGHPRSHSVHGSGHGCSLSQVNLRPEGSGAFNLYDHQQQQQSSHSPLPMPLQAKSAPMNRLSLEPRASSPSIVIPQVKGRPQSALASYGATVSSPTESSPTSTTSVTYSHRHPNSPLTPGTVESRGTPTSAGTSMSVVSASVSAFGPRDQRKSETARLPPTVAMTASNFTARKLSVDVRAALGGSTTSASFLAPVDLPPPPPMGGGAARSSLGNGRVSNSSVEDMTDPQEALGTYTSKKPKTTLIRAFKQIINPRKVAEKDATKHKQEHFAWIEMQKSLKRVLSPEIGKEWAFFPSDDNLDDIQDQDPFEVLKRCHVMRDTVPILGAATANSLLDFGPMAFVQVDKVARNVNQRGPHLTPQLLSQKYLTRPYSKAPLSKLRVLFVWVSENIRLDGGPTRDVSGGRYKLGPGADTPSNGNAAEESPSLRAGSNGGAGSPSSSAGAAAAAWMPGAEEYSRGLLQEDSPELAQEVLTSRTCKTGEGFANLFAEMALAAGIEDVGVVKGYIKGPMDVFSKDVPPANHAWNVVRINGTYRFIDCCLASPFHPAHYPNRPQSASSFYFLTSPTDLVLSHFPMFLTYQYITPSIPPQIFLRLPFVRPAFFDFGLSLPEFKRRTRLDIKDDESIEVVIRIDGGGASPGSLGAAGGGAGSHAGNGQHGTIAGLISGPFGGECLSRGCGEGIELRAEVEAMTAEGKVIKKRALAQIMIWNPYQAQVAAITAQAQQVGVQGGGGGQASSSLSVGGSIGSTSAVAASAASAAVVIAMGQHHPPHHRQPLPHHCTGIRIAKIKAVLPSETVVGAGGIRKGVVHIYAGRKVENAPSDATPYSLALTLPIRHSGTMPKTPFNFVFPHFSPYEFYVKSPQSEMLYYPHTYKFCVLSLAAQGQASAVSANAVANAENDAAMTIAATSSNNMGNDTSTVVGSHTTSPRHLKANGTNGSELSGSASMAPLCRPQPNAQKALRSVFNAANGPGGPLTATTTSPSVPSMSSPPPRQHHSQYQMSSSISMASTSLMSINGVSSNSAGAGNTGGGGGVAIARPERLVLRTQMNRIYKLVYDPVRQCHEAQVEVKERGIWECVRMDDGGKSRVAREGASGVVIATWRCV
ncbi:cytokinesis protein 3 [Mortierella sp. AD031]|nr:cytokinesis protein 3 [Mortierella sp. AD031]